MLNPGGNVGIGGKVGNAGNVGKVGKVGNGGIENVGNDGNGGIENVGNVGNGGKVGNSNSLAAFSTATGLVRPAEASEAISNKVIYNIFFVKLLFLFLLKI